MHEGEDHKTKLYALFFTHRSHAIEFVLNGIPWRTVVGFHKVGEVVDRRSGRVLNPAMVHPVDKITVRDQPTSGLTSVTDFLNRCIRLRIVTFDVVHHVTIDQSLNGVIFFQHRTFHGPNHGDLKSRFSHVVNLVLRFLSGVQQDFQAFSKPIIDIVNTVPGCKTVAQEKDAIDTLGKRSCQNPSFTKTIIVSLRIEMHLKPAFRDHARVKRFRMINKQGKYELCSRQSCEEKPKAKAESQHSRT